MRILSFVRFLKSDNRSRNDRHSFFYKKTTRNLHSKKIQNSYEISENKVTCIGLS